MADPIGDRMKAYEKAARATLPRRMPVIVRVDGKAFHTYTRGCARPFDEALMGAMDAVGVALCEEMQGAALAFVQSDEISVLLHNYRRLDTDAWFDNQVQKIASVSASIAAATMTCMSPSIFGATRPAHFDARVFVLPEAEVCNYFLWRQQDATRNSIQTLAQSLYSQRELHGKNSSVLQEMIFQNGINWNDLPVRQKRGRCVVRNVFDVDGVVRHQWVVDDGVPIFSRDRAYIERYLATEDETVAQPAEAS
jgi:tRNA(His) guanylyltransferase